MATEVGPQALYLHQTHNALPYLRTRRHCSSSSRRRHLRASWTWETRALCCSSVAWARRPCSKATGSWGPPDGRSASARTNRSFRCASSRSDSSLPLVSPAPGVGGTSDDPAPREPAPWGVCWCVGEVGTPLLPPPLAVQPRYFSRMSAASVTQIRHSTFDERKGGRYEGLCHEGSKATTVADRIRMTKGSFRCSSLQHKYSTFDNASVSREHASSAKAW